MNFRMTKVLRFWVDVECERIKKSNLRTTQNRPNRKHPPSIRGGRRCHAVPQLKRRNCLESDPRNVDEAGRCRAGGTG
jgi:hypothetical protein